MTQNYAGSKSFAGFCKYHLKAGVIGALTPSHERKQHITKFLHSAQLHHLTSMLSIFISKDQSLAILEEWKVPSSNWRPSIGTYSWQRTQVPGVTWEQLDCNALPQLLCLHCSSVRVPKLPGAASHGSGCCTELNHLDSWAENQSTTCPYFCKPGEGWEKDKLGEILEYHVLTSTCMDSY